MCVDMCGHVYRHVHRQPDLCVGMGKHTHTWSRMSMHIFIHMIVHICIRVFMCMRIPMSIHTLIQAYSFVYTHPYVHVYMFLKVSNTDTSMAHVWTHACMRVYTHVCINVCAHVHTCTFTCSPTGGKNHASMCKDM